VVVEIRLSDGRGYIRYVTKGREVRWGARRKEAF